jgi:drug/metabolite transporter (DMT)-like permease
VLLGGLGVLSFSVTFPATTAAETSFSPVVVGVGRTVIAAALAAAVLAGRGEKLLPPREAWREILVVSATVGVGFGLLSALALRHVSSVHGAVLTGLIPAATAGMAVLRAGERPRPGYWIALGLGLVVVVGFAVSQGGGRLRAPDVLLLAGIAVGGIGYTEGGMLARRYGGWRVICWAVIISLPLSLPVTLAAAVASPPRHVTAGAVLGLAYVGLVPMCLGFFAWYDGLARGGVARIGRLQLAQPALTLGWSALLLGEHVSWLTAGAAAAVIVVTAVGRNARVDQPLPEPGRDVAVGHAAAAVERDPEVHIGPVRVRQRDHLGRLVVHRAVDDRADLVAQRDPGH